MEEETTFYVLPPVDGSIKPNSQAQVISIASSEIQIALFLTELRCKARKIGESSKIYRLAMKDGPDISFTALEYVNAKRVRVYFQVWNRNTAIIKSSWRLIDEYFPGATYSCYEVKNGSKLIKESTLGYSTDFIPVDYYEETLTRRVHLIDSLREFCEKQNN